MKAALRAGIGTVALLCSASSLAVDWTDVPIVEDGACEFRHGLWVGGTARRHGLKSTQEMQAFGIRRAQERCKNGMVLLISSLHSGVGDTVGPTLNVARALCRVPDIEEKVVPAYENYTVTQVRCTISKLGNAVSVAPSSLSPPVSPAPQ